MSRAYCNRLLLSLQRSNKPGMNGERYCSAVEWTTTWKKVIPAEKSVTRHWGRYISGVWEEQTPKRIQVCTNKQLPTGMLYKIMYKQKVHCEGERLYRVKIGGVDHLLIMRWIVYGGLRPRPSRCLLQGVPPRGCTCLLYIFGSIQMRVPVKCVFRHNREGNLHISSRGLFCNFRSICRLLHEVR